MSSLRTRKVFESSTLSLIAVERIDSGHSGPSADYWHVHGSLSPIALLVRYRDELLAFDMEGQPLSVDELKRDLAPGVV